jgi:hypothetical protein
MAVLALRPRNKQDSNYSGELHSSAFSGGSLNGPPLGARRDVIYHRQIGGDDDNENWRDFGNNGGEEHDVDAPFASYTDMENNMETAVNPKLIELAMQIKKISPVSNQTIITAAVQLSLKSVASMVSSSMQTSSACTTLLGQIAKFALRSSKKSLIDMAKYRKTSGFDEESRQTNNSDGASNSGKFLNLLGNAFSILGKRSKSASEMTPDELNELIAKNKKKGILTIDDGLDDKAGINITDTVMNNYTPSKDGGPAKPTGKVLRNSVNINFDDDPDTDKFKLFYKDDKPPADDRYQDIDAGDHTRNQVESG